MLCCTAARFDPEMYDARASKVRAEGVDSVADVVLERWFTPEFRAARPETVESAGSMLRGTPAEGIRGLLRGSQGRRRAGQARGDPAPTLVIAGAGRPSGHCGSGREEIRDSIPQARLVVIEAAHLANIEQPEAVTRDPGTSRAGLGDGR